ncbi:hypothetical protein SDC9_157236 [bioreactor metagenome]|uniref:Uncharacterized protein n=1 Tax=bioreactor metagenome TaxID=1076179 RepID=A0A645FC58_9ZZZZ
MCSPVALRQLGIAAEPGRHLGHDSRGLQPGRGQHRVRADQVVGRRKRRSARQPWIGCQHTGVSGRAPVGDSGDTAHRAAELRLGELGVRIGEGLVGGHES